MVVKNKLFNFCLIKLSFIFIFQSITSSFAYAADSTYALNYTNFLNIVKKYHPVVKQAQLDVQIAKAQLTEARGVFNPLLSAYNASKSFAGTQYYTTKNVELTVPTWYGIDVVANMDYLSGSRLNPEETMGNTSFAGFSIPLIKNVLYDKRRYAVQQAKLFVSMSNTEQQIAVNNIMYDAAYAYWDWVSAYLKWQIVKRGLTANEKRYLIVKQSFELGERPAIDTTEALSQLQSFEILYNEKMLDVNNAAVELSAYLWDSSGNNVVLPIAVVPSDDITAIVTNSMVQVPITQLIDSLLASNPSLNYTKQKGKSLLLDKRAKFQDLLPKLDFKYNFLSKGNNFLKGVGTNNLFVDNYQYALKFEMPLFLSYGRGAYRKAQLKIKWNQWELADKTVYYTTKLKQYYNDNISYSDQYLAQVKNLDNYKKLLAAEELRFTNGESSIFLINTRELKLLEAEEKTVDLQTKTIKSQISMLWTIGDLNRL